VRPTRLRGDEAHAANIRLRLVESSRDAHAIRDVGGGTADVHRRPTRALPGAALDDGDAHPVSREEVRQRAAGDAGPRNQYGSLDRRAS